MRYRRCLWSSRRSKTRLDFLDLSRIVQGKGLAQNGISLIVSMQAEPVRTVQSLRSLRVEPRECLCIGLNSERNQ